MPAGVDPNVAHAPHPPLPEYYRGEEERRTFVRRIFDATAGDYDRIERLMAFGSGPWYRRQALLRAGLAPGMRVLDVAVGTGLVAREAVAVLGGQGLVVGLDPSIGMLRSTGGGLDIATVQGVAESLPFEDGRFDFVSMGFALRHMSDLTVVFSELHRVLVPGGTACILEITRPRGRVAHALVKTYMRGVVPVLAKVFARQAETARLMRYYWDTIEACVPPERVLATLQAAGFGSAGRHVELGIFSEYTARKLA
jgi:demethylmenaquinone methyltransferase / 2-methoxy-6-polyprenyl-1,4-benzoquinol methylase